LAIYPLLACKTILVRSQCIVDANAVVAILEFMTNAETLRYARNLLLSLHKALVDRERASYEAVNGQQNAGQFLNLLLENPDFAWLRKFSMLIVEIDEMFDLKDGISDEMVLANLQKVRELISLNDIDESFRAKYQEALQNDVDAAGLQAQLQGLVGEKDR
jgi:hypothetical protein